MMNKIVNALYELRPNSKWALYGDSYDDLVWQDAEQSKPTEEEINAILPTIEIAMANKEQAAKDAKASALAKLAALGLTQEEVKALVG